MTTETDELDNPTEWSGIIGTALLCPERRDEMERRAELKIACSHAIFCRCSQPLDQITAWIIKIDGRAAGVLCRTCTIETLQSTFNRAATEAPPETVRQNIRDSICARTWSRDYTGENLLELIEKSDSTSAPRTKIVEDENTRAWTRNTAGELIDELFLPRKKAGRKKPAAFSPAEIAAELIGAAPEVWCFPYMVLRPTAAAMQKLTNKRHKSSTVNVRRGLDFLKTTKHGAELFQTPEVEGIVTLTDPDQLRTYSADARKIRTCERNTEPGGKWFAPIGTNSPLVYRVNGETVALLMPMD